jgi:hypothetical protein
MLRLVEYVRTCMYVCELVQGMSNILESLCDELVLVVPGQQLLNCRFA